MGITVQSFGWGRLGGNSNWSWLDESLFAGRISRCNPGSKKRKRQSRVSKKHVSKKLTKHSRCPCGRPRMKSTHNTPKTIKVIICGLTLGWGIEGSIVPSMVPKVQAIRRNGPHRMEPGNGNGSLSPNLISPPSTPSYQPLRQHTIVTLILEIATWNWPSRA